MSDTINKDTINKDANNKPAVSPRYVAAEECDPDQRLRAAARILAAGAVRAVRMHQGTGTPTQDECCSAA